VAEVLEHVLGFFVVDDHISPNLAVRGISGGLYSDSSIIKVLIDGHSVAFSSTGGNLLGPALVPLTAVDRVEIIRGPASALYGADAFLGVINIKTRDGKSLEGSTAWLSGGRVGSHWGGDADASAGLSHGMADVVVAFRRTLLNLSGLTLPATSPAPASPSYPPLNVPLTVVGAPPSIGSCCFTSAFPSPVEVTRAPLAERPVTNSRAG